jgi:transglutaminase-like putative cysteine protease
MNTLPGLLAGACALWAFQTGYWLVALAAAIALEAPRVVALRWELEQRHFNRLSDLCVVLIASTGVLLYFSYGNPRGLLLVFEWMPLLTLPLALAQAWGSLREVDLTAFAWTMRRGAASERVTINLGYPDLAVWVAGAAAANTRGHAFYFALAALAAWALWGVRPRRYPLALWAALIGAAVAAGYGIHHGLYSLQAWIEDVVPEWIAMSGSRTDPYLSRTALGSIGELKDDDSIVLRVRIEGALELPLLLHRSSYNTYVDRSWIAQIAPLVPGAPGARRPARGEAAPQARVTVYDYSPHGNPVLSLPRDTVALRGIDTSSLRENSLGTVQADLTPGYFDYVAVVSRGARVEGVPSKQDLRIPPGEQRLFHRIANRLGLPGLPPEQAVATVERYFARGFRYTLYLKGSRPGLSAIDDFLLRTHAGHCEYFATATVLLLRAAGIPARYATGFSVDEYSSLERAYIVRLRDAHAWARAYVGDRWIDVDTTPPTWIQAEARAASAWWVPAYDLWAWLTFRSSQLGAGAQGQQHMTALAAGAALLIALWLAWRLSRARRLMRSGRRSRGAGETPVPQGADSEFYLIERRLERLGLGRLPAETTMAWLARVRGRLPAGADADALLQIARLHYRYRFDPEGLPGPERARLRESVARWLRRHAAT